MLDARYEKVREHGSVHSRAVLVAVGIKDLETILKGFTAGRSVQVRVVAANDGGEAPPSPVMTAVVTERDIHR